MRTKPLAFAVAALILGACSTGAAGESATTPPASADLIEENARLKAENEFLRREQAVPPNAAAAYEAAAMSARDAKRKSDLQAYETAAYLYAADHDQHFPVVADDEFKPRMVAGGYIQRVLPAPLPDEHYCYAYNPQQSDIIFSAWLEERDGAYGLGGDLTDAFLGRMTRGTYFGGSSCPAPPGWTGVRL